MSSSGLKLTLAEHDDDEAGCAAPVVLVSLRMWIHDKKWFEFILWMDADGSDDDDNSK